MFLDLLIATSILFISHNSLKVLEKQHLCTLWTYTESFEVMWGEGEESEGGSADFLA